MLSLVGLSLFTQNPLTDLQDRKPTNPDKWPLNQPALDSYKRLDGYEKEFRPDAHLLGINPSSHTIAIWQVTLSQDATDMSCAEIGPEEWCCSPSLASKEAGLKTHDPIHYSVKEERRYCNREELTKIESNLYAEQPGVSDIRIRIPDIEAYFNQSSTFNKGEFLILSVQPEIESLIFETIRIMESKSSTITKGAGVAISKLESESSGQGLSLSDAFIDIFEPNNYGGHSLLIVIINEVEHTFSLQDINNNNHFTLDYHSKKAEVNSFNKVRFTLMKRYFNKEEL